ncbi:CDP-alcohol phosphatidyltransferase family protein [Oceanicola sp. 22II-s10i]|uniref:CDP-alcohol phosphatidyltransferase family protein n=1 Tax=Oceanicola sp. 22II-s10i TaxID=1317116 RepID=UPI000B524366|nr:CDP-alcohol phosphatidyltransferase family protein [Oceanicola sp. 22II-s10i]
MPQDHTPGPAALARSYLGSDKFQEELRGNWVMVLLHRWPAFLLAALCMRIGISANAITLAGGALALAMPVAAALLPFQAAVWSVVILGFAVITLDCSDGDVARHGGGSELGARLDLAVDMMFWGLLYGSIGLLADRAVGEMFGVWTVVGLSAAWARLLARVYHDEAGGAPTTGRAPWTPLAMVTAFVAGISGAIPFLALAVAHWPAAVWCLVAYSLIDVADALSQLLRTDRT